MPPRSRDLLRQLRRSLQRNMQQEYGERAAPSFLRAGAGPTEMTAADFNSHVLNSQPFVLRDPSLRCTDTRWTLGFIEEAAGDDVVGVETSANNRFYSGKGHTEVQMPPNLTQRLYLAEKNVKQLPGLERDVAELPFAGDMNLP
eukprot:gene37723-18922_t